MSLATAIVAGSMELLDGLLEKSLFFPSLLFLNGYLIYQNYSKYTDLLKSLIK